MNAVERLQWEALEDIFQTVIHSGVSPQGRQVLSTLLVSDPDHTLFWEIVRRVFRLIDGPADPAVETQAEADARPENIARMKQMAFYLLANVNRLEAWAPHAEGDANLPPDLMGLSMASVNEILVRYRDFLIAQADVMGDLLKSKKV